MRFGKRGHGGVSGVGVEVKWQIGFGDSGFRSGGRGMMGSRWRQRGFLVSPVVS